jgi:hypothetical protein
MKLFFAFIFFTVPLLASAVEMTNTNHSLQKIHQSPARLNPIFFKDNKLDSMLREQLIQLGDSYFSRLKKIIPDIKLADMIFAGDLAGYNYNKNSEIDLHLIIDLEDVSCDQALLSKFINFISQEWHEDKIPLAHYSVRISIGSEVNGQAGVYSLFNDKWLHRPLVE